MNRRFALWSTFPALIVVVHAWAHQTTAEQPFERVRIAGTFNQWATADDDYALVKVGERYSLSRFWPCGTYEFKFVFDGSWGRHLGDAGDGKLTQPGRNIELTISQSAEYAIWYDQQSSRWGVQRRPAARPHAVIRVHDAHTGDVRLDATASTARHGHPIRTYKWRVRLLAPQDRRVEGDQTWEPPPSATTTFRVSRPGRYQIQLTISDGEYQDQAAITCSLHHGWRLTYRPKDQPPAAGGVMLPFGDGALGWVFTAQGDGQAVLQIDRATGSTPMLIEGSRPVRTKHGRRYLATLRPKTGPTISLQEDEWREFRYQPRGDDRLPRNFILERVDLVGDFNQWKPGATPMSSTQDGTVYRTFLELPTGIYHYNFLLNGSVYLEDTEADPQFRRTDGTGGFNSGARIGPDAGKLGPVGPHQIVQEALKHDPHRATYFTLISENLVRLTLRTLADDVESVALLPLAEDQFHADVLTPIPLRRLYSRHGFDYWAVQVRIKKRLHPFEYSTCRGETVSGKMEVTPWLQYAFLVTDGVQRLLLGQEGDAARAWSQRVQMPFGTPDWAKRAVWYQIFPERFRNGDTSNDPMRTVPWRHEWSKPYKPAPGSTPNGFEETGEFYRYIYDRRYGGDLQGIREKLPYLRELGITAIYLNPVFQADSLHKYDTSDYRHIDDGFGVRGGMDFLQGETADPATWQWSPSDRLFLDFLAEAHRLGFKVIIDGVFNHTGRGFWAFQDVLKNGKDSPYADWFDVKSWEPFHYRAWDREDGDLPRLRHDDALGLCRPVREHLFAITRRWMDPDGDGDPSDGIDGWRLDVASDINANFWGDWRTLVKSINPDAYIVAELWDESRQWLDGRTFDAAMHYPFAASCQRFFVNRNKAIAPTRFQRELADALTWYPPQVNFVLQTLFDSHDTDRLASMFMNPDLVYDEANRIQDNGPSYNPAKPTPDCYRRLRAMVTMQMTWIGAPMVYYGDEVGMYGADDPSCRKPMYWPDLMPYDDANERIEADVLEHYRRMIAIRNSFPALQLGLYQPLLADDETGVFAFARSLGEQTLVVVLNNGDQTYKLDLPAPWPQGTTVLRLDNPAAFEIVQPDPKNAKARPTIRPLKKYESPIKIKDGRMQGIDLPPRTAAVFGGKG